MLFARSAAVRTPAQRAVMRRAGRVVAEMHEEIRNAIRPGVTTAQLDQIGREVLDRRGASSNFLGYHGYPAVICASPNEVIVHGIPSDAVVLNEGDIVSIDCGAIVDGWHGDAAFTAPVGEVSAEVASLIHTAEASLAAGIAQLVEGRRLGDVGRAVQEVAERGGYSVVREYTGHAIGQAMHEQPSVANWGTAGTGVRIRAGNVFAVEPMLNLGGADTLVLDDEWSVVTADGRWSAHVEHSIAVTLDGPEILTLP
jgi:methionyl aminopeptidase